MTDLSEASNGVARVSFEEILPPPVFSQKEHSMQHDNPYIFLT